MKPQPGFYEQLDHTGDCGIDVYAPSFDGLFVNVARAFSDLVVGLELLEPVESRELTVGGSDQLSLLFNLLDELLYQFEVEGLIFGEFELVSLDEDQLVLRAVGEPWSQEKHSYRVAIKAPTYHQMEIEQQQSRWRARVIFDL